MQRCRYAKTANPSLSRDQGIRRRSQNLIIPQSPGLATVEPSIPWRPWRWVRVRTGLATCLVPAED
jgi:hypothetical protein